MEQQTVSSEERMRVKQILEVAKQRIDKIFMQLEEELCADLSQPAPIFLQIERAFCRVFSPNELETIREWMAQYPPDLIELALGEAVSRNILNIKYIDKILFSWEKAGVKDAKAAVEYTMQFQHRTAPQPVPQVVAEQSERVAPKVPFYNWLEERG